MIDTHTHLQFKAFQDRTDEVIRSANEAGIKKIIVVGTNLETSKKAIQLAKKHEGLYASVGIHPHHIFGIKNHESRIMEELEKLIDNPKVVAIGETGLDRHIYKNTKYQNYQITEEFMDLQKTFFKEQVKLAIKYKKSLIIHNRNSVPELLEILEQNWHPFLEQRSVFHCCEPNQKLLNFALKHKIFLSIDGDITYNKDKQDFVKQIPLELFVLETDSPYFIPEPLRSKGITINEPKNLKVIAQFIVKLKNMDLSEIKSIISQNSLRLFNL